MNLVVIYHKADKGDMNNGTQNVTFKAVHIMREASTYPKLYVRQSRKGLFFSC